MMQENKKINIAIDGHSSCGKSTLAKDLAKELNYVYVDSGAMYRAVALFAIQEKIEKEEIIRVAEKLHEIKIELKTEDGRFDIFLNGHHITERIKHPDVSAIVSEVAAIPAVRVKLVEIQQALGMDKGVVMDGRDIGTVVFPEAELKLFVTADINTRAQRRFDELQEKGLTIEIDQVKKNLAHRDHIDSTREDSPLIRAADAILIDNSALNRIEQLQLALKLANAKIKKPRS